MATAVVMVMIMVMMVVVMQLRMLMVGRVGRYGFSFARQSPPGCLPNGRQDMTPDQPASEPHEHDPRTHLQPPCDLVQRLAGQVQRPRGDCNHQYGNQCLKHRGCHGENRAIAHRFAICNHIRAQHRLAVAGPKRMKHAIAEREPNQPPCRPWPLSQLPNRGIELFVKMRLPHRHLPIKLREPA